MFQTDHYTCPHCGLVFRAKTDDVFRHGDVRACPHCHTRVRIDLPRPPLPLDTVPYGPSLAGRVADYIPQLGRVNPEHLAVAACTVDGQRLALGDAEVNFCLQSVSKPVNYCLALEEHGEAVVHRHVGREPRGRGFNELMLNNKEERGGGGAAAHPP